MGTGIHEGLGRKSVFLGAAMQPRTAVNEQEDRRFGLLGAKDIEHLDLSRAIRLSLWRAEAPARQFAVARKSGKNLTAERRIERLIVGGIELDLIQIHPDARPLCVRRRADLTLLAKRRASGHRGRRAKHRAPRDRPHDPLTRMAVVEAHFLTVPLSNLLFVT